MSFWRSVWKDRWELGILVFTFILIWNNPILGFLFICMLTLFIIYNTLKEILDELKWLRSVTTDQALAIATYANMRIKQGTSPTMSHGGHGGGFPN
jgi:hypothetical protein